MVLRQVPLRALADDREIRDEIIGPKMTMYQIATPTCNRQIWPAAQTIGVQVMQRP
jgi:hypothetical protein